MRHPCYELVTPDQAVSVVRRWVPSQGRGACGIGAVATRTGCVGVTLRSRCDVASLGLNPWDVQSIETVVAGGDVLQDVVDDKATALK